MQYTQQLPGKRVLLPLTQNIRLYLTDFLKRRNRAKTGKISQKCACETHARGAFTISALTIIGA
jgi:hypothetical protein